MMNAKRVSWLAILALLPAGCGAPATDSEENVASKASALDPYGAIQVTPTLASNIHTSETSVLVNNWSSGNVTTLISFDSAAQAGQGTPFMSFTQTTRTICPGAQLFGYSVQSGPPSTTAYTQMSPNWSLQPSAAWPVWMGSTSLGQFPASPYIYLATLAIPNFNMPKSGCLTGDVSGLVGGACILRSLNPGPPGTIPVFTQSDDDCLHNDYYDPYDSTEVVGTTVGNIYAAFHDPITQQIEVYWSPSPSGAFAPAGTPFWSESITEAPRMVDDGNGGVYIIAGGIDPATGYSEIFFTHMNQNTASGSAPVTGGTYLGNGATIPEGAGYKVPLHAQYDLAMDLRGGIYVSWTSALTKVVIGNDDDPSGFTTIVTTDCGAPGQSGGCNPAAQYEPSSAPGTYMFNPASASTVRTLGTSTSLAMKVTWLQLTNYNPSNPSASWVDVYSADYNDTTHYYRVRKEAGYDGTSTLPNGPTEACPVPVDGRWDEYNEHLGVYQPSPSSRPQFVRAFPDDSFQIGCPQLEYTSESLTSATNILWP